MCWIKILLKILLITLFILQLPIAVYAQGMTHSKEADIDGEISWTSPGQTSVQTSVQTIKISGIGVLTKKMDSAQINGEQFIENLYDQVKFNNAVNNLNETSVIELCAPPKYIMNDEDFEEFRRFLKPDDTVITDWLSLF